MTADEIVKCQGEDEVLRVFREAIKKYWFI